MYVHVHVHTKNTCAFGVFSAYSEPVSFCTTGAAPSHPEPPMLSQKFVRALTISWVRRPSDEEFRLQMEDFATVSSLPSSVCVFYMYIVCSKFIIELLLNRVTDS